MNRFAYEMCIAILAIFCLLKQCEVLDLTETVANQAGRVMDLQMLAANCTSTEPPLHEAPLHEDATCEDTIELDENDTGIIGRENAIPHDDIAIPHDDKDKVPEDFMQQNKIYKISDKNAMWMIYDISREQQYEKRDTWAAIRELQREVAKCTKREVNAWKPDFEGLVDANDAKKLYEKLDNLVNQLNMAPDEKIETDEDFLLRIGHMDWAERLIMGIVKGGSHTLNELKIMDLKRKLKKTRVLKCCIVDSIDFNNWKWTLVDMRDKKEAKTLKCMVLGVEALLAYGVYLFSVDDYGFTAGSLAILYGHEELAALIGAEAQRREIIATERKCIAFAMGMHKRLGVGSWVQSLNPDLLKMVDGFM
ncbi:hypothetical protein T484DRAFT_1859011 [Baffinella frigidus]|nr:hypothetical protein T484DRAFT_1859011 [Cryptophyta sp. CCMP2293]